MRVVALGLLLAFVVAASASCGARTGLPVPPRCEPIDLELPRHTPELDMNVLLDASFSMTDPVAGDVTKWDATTTAVKGFLDAAGAGLGVSLTFFPEVDPAVPEMCSSGASACGDPTACTVFGVCVESLTLCDVSVGCVETGIPDEPCEDLGVCQGDSSALCSAALGISCPSGLGPCLPYALCENHFSCRVEHYAVPAVPVNELPAAASAVVGAMEARSPDGSTTTLPALRGAHEQAAAAVATRSGRRQVVVLATDGLPTSCDPSLDGGSDEIAIQNVADVAAAAADAGVRTFVIGVFAADEAERAQQNLDTIAQAGGAETAFIVGADGDLSGDFARALEQARLVASSCEFAFPEGNGELELDGVEVELVLGSREGELLGVLASASACSAGLAGAYTVDDASGRRLVLCPSVCERATGIDAVIQLTRVCRNPDI